MAEPLGSGEDDYTVPTYTELQPGSDRVSVVLRNLSSRSVTLEQGKVVAKLGAANAIPDA